MVGVAAAADGSRELPWLATALGRALENTIFELRRRHAADIHAYDARVEELERQRGAALEELAARRRLLELDDADRTPRGEPCAVHGDAARCAARDRADEEERRAIDAEVARATAALEALLPLANIEQTFNIVDLQIKWRAAFRRAVASPSDALLARHTHQRRMAARGRSGTSNTTSTIGDCCQEEVEEEEEEETPESARDDADAALLARRSMRGERLHLLDPRSAMRRVSLQPHVSRCGPRAFHQLLDFAAAPRCALRGAAAEGENEKDEAGTTGRSDGPLPPPPKLPWLAALPSVECVRFVERCIASRPPRTSAALERDLRPQLDAALSRLLAASNGGAIASDATERVAATAALRECADSSCLIRVQPLRAPPRPPPLPLPPQSSQNFKFLPAAARGVEVLELADERDGGESEDAGRGAELSTAAALRRIGAEIARADAMLWDDAVDREAASVATLTALAIAPDPRIERRFVHNSFLAFAGENNNEEEDSSSSSRSGAGGGASSTGDVKARLPRTLVSGLLSLGPLGEFAVARVMLEQRNGD